MKGYQRFGLTLKDNRFPADQKMRKIIIENYLSAQNSVCTGVDDAEAEKEIRAKGIGDRPLRKNADSENGDEICA